MFTGSKNVQPGQHTTLVTGVGGQADAYTTEDVTVFWETVPSEFLPMALWLEADRMASLRIDKAAFEGEREVGSRGAADATTTSRTGGSLKS